MSSNSKEYEQIKGYYQHTKMIYDLAIASLILQQQRINGYGENLAKQMGGLLNYRRHYGMLVIDLGRNSGKTTYILNKADPKKDLIIVKHSFHIMHLIQNNIPFLTLNDIKEQKFKYGIYPNFIFFDGIYSQLNEQDLNALIQHYPSSYLIFIGI